MGLSNINVAIFMLAIIHVAALPSTPHWMGRRSTDLPGDPHRGASCRAVNNTVCDGSNAGACRTDCNPEPQATESECIAKGCCWERTFDAQGNPSTDLPWCFFPGGSPKCMLAQIAKDADTAVHSAAEAYHHNGTSATVEAYRSACLARGDWFYSFYLTPSFWVPGQSAFQSTKVTLVKYGCNAAACSESDITHVVHRIEAAQNPVNYDYGTHDSLKFTVTGYAVQKSPYVKSGAGGGSSNAVLFVVMTVLGIVLIAVTATAFHWFRKYQAQQREREVSNVYQQKKTGRDSFPAHVHTSLDQKPIAAVPDPLLEKSGTDDASLLDSEH